MLQLLRGGAAEPQAPQGMSRYEFYAFSGDSMFDEGFGIVGGDSGISDDIMEDPETPYFDNNINFDISDGAFVVDDAPIIRDEPTALPGNYDANDLFSAVGFGPEMVEDTPDYSIYVTEIDDVINVDGTGDGWVWDEPELPEASDYIGDLFETEPPLPDDDPDPPIPPIEEEEFVPDDTDDTGQDLLNDPGYGETDPAAGQDLTDDCPIPNLDPDDCMQCCDECEDDDNNDDDDDDGDGGGGAGDIPLDPNPPGPPTHPPGPIVEPPVAPPPLNPTPPDPPAPIKPIEEPHPVGGPKKPFSDPPVPTTGPCTIAGPNGELITGVSKDGDCIPDEECFEYGLPVPDCVPRNKPPPFTEPPFVDPPAVRPPAPPEPPVEPPVEPRAPPPSNPPVEPPPRYSEYSEVKKPTPVPEPPVEPAPAPAPAPKPPFKPTFQDLGAGGCSAVDGTGLVYTGSVKGGYCVPDEECFLFGQPVPGCVPKDDPVKRPAGDAPDGEPDPKGPKTGPDVDPVLAKEDDILDKEAKLFELINDYREENGLNRLQWDVRLQDAGKIVADYNNRTGKLSHTDGVNTDYNARPWLLRARSSGYTKVGTDSLENGSYWPRGTPEQVLQSWQDDPPHDWPMLREDFKGGAVVWDGDYIFWEGGNDPDVVSSRFVPPPAESPEAKVARLTDDALNRDPMSHALTENLKNPSTDTGTRVIMTEQLDARARVYKAIVTARVQAETINDVATATKAASVTEDMVQGTIKAELVAKAASGLAKGVAAAAVVDVFAGFAAGVFGLAAAIADIEHEKDMADGVRGPAPAPSPSPIAQPPKLIV